MECTGGFCATAASGDSLRATHEKKSPQKTRSSACIDGVTPAKAVCDRARQVTETVQLLTWVFMECQELREYWFKLRILVVLQQFCMFFPEEDLKNQTQIHTQVLVSFEFGKMSPAFTSHAHTVDWSFTTGGEKRRLFCPHFIPCRRGIQLAHMERYIWDPLGTLQETYTNNLFFCIDKGHRNVSAVN